MKLHVAPAWRLPLLIWALLVALLFWSQWPAVSGMAQLWWRSETFAHAMLVPPISAWLIWRRRADLLAIAPRAWWPGLLLLIPAIAVGVLGDLAEVNVLRHFGVVFCFQALCLLVFGWQAARCMAFPLLFLLFAPPFGEFMTAPMMQWTADFVVPALRGTGVPVYREGLHFVIPSGHWSVVEACSGVRYLMASFMVGTLFAYLNFERWPRRLGFMLVSLAVPIIANWLRAYLIVMLGHLSNNKIATGVDHLFYGWLFFGVVMMLMFWIGARFADTPAATDGASPGSVAATPVRPSPALALVVALLLCLPPWGLAGLRQEPQALPPWSAPAPTGWSSAAFPIDIWEPRFPGASALKREAWAQSPTAPAVGLDLAFFSAQRPDGKAISGDNVLARAEDDRWGPQGSLLREVDGLAQLQQRWMLRGNHVSRGFVSRRLFWVDGEFTASEVRAKWLGVRQLLAGRGDAAAVLVWITEADEGADARLDDFWRALQAPLNGRLSEMAGEAGGHNARRSNFEEKRGRE